jgi:hypothetical protein
MADDDTPSLPVVSRRELIAFAESSRPDWEPGKLDDAMRAAWDAGWGWERIVLRVARLVVTPADRPLDLLLETRQTPPAASVRDRGMPPALRALALAPAEAATQAFRAIEGKPPIEARFTGPQAALTEDAERELLREGPDP